MQQEEHQEHALTRLQRENKEWTKINFPNQQPYQMLLGIIEELGELEEGTSIFAETGDGSKLNDAIADVFIYTASYCNHLGFDFASIYEEALSYGDYYSVGRCIGSLCHHQLKREQKIRASEDTHLQMSRLWLVRLLTALFAEANLHIPDVLPTVLRVWCEEVQPRRWAPPSSP